MTQEEFYAACAAAMGVEHLYDDQRPKHLKFDRETGTIYKPPTRATRGGMRSGRMLGNGRFPGFGVVRDFGSQVQVALTKPVVVMRTFSSYETALAFLQEQFRGHRGDQGA